MVSTIKFSQFASAGDIGNGATTVGLDATLTINSRFNNPWTFLPSGTTAQRPAPSVAINYRLRLNTDTQTYEFYDAVAGIWTQLLDSGFTGVVVLAPSADQTITGAHNLIMATGSMIAPTMLAGNLSLSGNTLSSTNSNGNINLIPNGTGQILGLGSVSFAPSPGIQIQKIGNEAAFTAGSFVNLVGSAPKFYGYKSRSTSIGTHVAVQSGDELTILTAFGDDGTTFSPAAQIRILAGSTISSGIVSGTLQLNTASSLGVMTNALSISDAQIVTLTNPLPSNSGGTGVNNGGSTLTLAGSLATSGAFASSFTMTGATAVTFPISGTLATTAGVAAGFVALAPSGIQTITNFDLVVHGVTIGNGAFASVNNLAVGQGALAANVSGVGNVAIGPTALATLTTGNSTTAVGNAAGTNSAFGANITTGTRNTFIGNGASGNNAAASGVIALGCFSVADIATGATSADNGSGIAIGSSTTPVGFRGDGTIYPGFMGAGEWRMKINDTYYMIPLLADGATSLGALRATQISFTTTSGIIGSGTNDNAAVGSVGQYVETILLSSGSLVALTTNTATNIVQLTSLPAGDWDVWGNWCLDVAGASTMSIVTGWISSTSATQPDLAFQSRLENQTLNNSDVCMAISTKRFSLSSPTTIYMSMLASYTGGTISGFGAIYARLRR
jgi:hypothetical protein